MYEKSILTSYLYCTSILFDNYCICNIQKCYPNGYIRRLELHRNLFHIQRRNGYPCRKANKATDYENLFYHGIGM